MSKGIQYLDIFEMPIKRSREAREKEFRDLVHQMQNLNLIKCPQYLGKLSFLCAAGYLSGRVASYFLAGRVSAVDRNVLSYFLNFLNDYEESEMVDKSLFYLSTWHNSVKDVVTENTFLFPLAELASKDDLGIDFSSEVREYNVL